MVWNSQDATKGYNLKEGRARAVIAFITKYFEVSQPPLRLMYRYDIISKS
jgi:hypothetical protein